MQRILKIFLTLFFISDPCLADKVIKVEGVNGVWKGDINVYNPKALWGEEKSLYKIVISNCGGDFQLWWDTDGKGYKRHESNYEVKKGGSHHTLTAIYQAKSENSWIESRYWSLAEDKNTVYAQWSRMVSNPGEADEFSHFSQFGEGMLLKVSETCEKTW